MRQKLRFGLLNQIFDRLVLIRFQLLAPAAVRGPHGEEKEEAQDLATRLTKPPSWSRAPYDTFHANRTAITRSRRGDHARVHGLVHFAASAATSFWRTYCRAAPDAGITAIRAAGRDLQFPAERDADIRALVGFVGGQRQQDCVLSRPRGRHPLDRGELAGEGHRAHRIRGGGRTPDDCLSALPQPTNSRIHHQRRRADSTRAS